MAYLAMHGLGFGSDDIERFAARYRRRLAPLPSADVEVSVANWREQFGRIEAYPALLHFFDREVVAHGARATVARYLPHLISGWARHAFHPLIRLGYGIEFGAPSEVVAGLAYLACSGDDPMLAHAAERAPTMAGGCAFLEDLQVWRNGSLSPGAFGANFQRIVEAVPLKPAGNAGEWGTLGASLSRACLDVFHATHDFFALHLVTGSHAFRVCAPWAGPNLNAIFSVGIGAAYLAIGAPPFRSLGRAEADLPMTQLAATTDEHDLKIAYTCSAQAQAYADATYVWVAHAYLTSRSQAAKLAADA